ncbi:MULTISPECIES: patatin-like phospholipase family protein [Flavobacterium]|uniref:Patatin n=1 Tax=Flavobacterium aurantiibacter TaxID=2023067 RepID=A0A255ZAH0_9FLAO|nr:patatin-like phospholipase family protein [Flavobacterium aurantiibacter]OYQ38456.1 patatin [Flavobacterium aurantiibacter]OYQ38485.1 patatin [Flavobacterium aurantiibacter]
MTPLAEFSSAVGYVFSGGGSKGLAHAGALKFLEEVEVFPSEIACSSAGSIVASLYAWGKTPEEILSFFQSVDFFYWRHFTFRKAGLMDSEAFASYLDAIFGEATIGDLKIPIHITATDMIRGKLTVFSAKTRIKDAVVASAAFPGIISPHVINGKVYSDGGILNHFPADILQGRCDYLIGMYVSPLQAIEAKDLRTIKHVTARAFDLLSANTNNQKFNICDWVITPDDLSAYSTFETKTYRMRQIFDIGYQAARDAYFQKFIHPAFER